MDIAFKRQQGFTLIELITVILIIGILYKFAASTWPGTPLGLAGQTEQLANDIRYAQALAMTQGQRYSWVKTSATSYQIQNNAGTAITLSQGSTTVTLAADITFGSLTNLPNNSVTFDGRGTPYSTTSSPGTSLASNASIPLTASGETHTVTIEAGTGGVLYQ